MRLFYYLARNISYTFSVVFFTVLIGWITIAFSIFFGSAFIIVTYEQLWPVLLKWLPITTLIITLCHFIQFGFLSPLKIPPFLKAHRAINSAYVRDFQLDDERLKELYIYCSDLPMHNTLACVLYSCAGMVLLMVFCMYEYRYAGTIDIEQLKIIMRMGPLSLSILTILYGISTYLITEYLTNRERSLVYRSLVSRGITVKMRALMGLRIKFAFFVVLMVITLLTFGALMEKSRFYNETNIAIILSYFSLSVLGGLSLVLVITNSIFRVLNDIRRVSREIASGGLAMFNNLSLDTEFSSIEYALMEMAWEIEEHRKNLEDMVEQRTLELQNALSDLKVRDDQIQKQLDMASIIQQSILPGRIDDWNELKFAIRYIAMEKIGGDFYDVHQLADDRLGILVADVSGHGIPAALVTTMVKISFGNAGNLYNSPRRIFQEVNQNILDHVKTQDYLTCFMVSIDDEYNVVYSNASHRQAILWRAETGEIEFLDTNGLFIGALEDARESYEEKVTRLNYGDRLILYTDGIPEATNKDRQEYADTRLTGIIKENAQMQLEDFANAIIDDVQKHVGQTQIEDDMTLLVIELARDEAVDMIKTARKMISQHQYNEAIEHLRRGMERFPDNSKIQYNLAKTYFRINNYKDAAENIDRYIEKEKRNKYAFYLGGASMYQMTDYSRAVDYFNRALEIDANFVNALFGAGMASKKIGDREGALKAFEKVVNIDPDNRMAHFELRELKEEK